MRWLLGVCGASAAVAVPQQILVLRERGIDVTIALSQNAGRFASAEMLAAFSRNKVYASVFDGDAAARLPHVELAEQCDVFVIMPASAAMIAKLAHGAADDLVSAIAVHADLPIFVVPALNAVAARNFFVSRNLDVLREAGMTIIDSVGTLPLRVVSAVQQEEASYPSMKEVIEVVDDYFLSRKRLNGESGVPAA